MVKRDKRLVVIGGGAAGMSAAAVARRFQRDLEIVVLERSPNVSFILCGLPYYVSNLIPELDSLIVYTPEYFQSERDIDVRTRHEVRRIDAEGMAVEYTDLTTGEQSALSYDKLVIAAGAQAILPNVPGLGLPGIFTLRSLESGASMKEFVAQGKAKRAAIIGAGYIGLEIAEALSTAGAAVTIIEASPSVMPGSEPEIAKLIEAELSRHHVDLRKQQLALSFEANAEGAVERVVTDGGDVPADIAVVAVGARADVAIAREAGVELGETRGIVTDESMRTNIPDIYAAGDCVETRHLLTGKPVYLPLGTTANKQGRVAGENAAGGHATFGGIVGSAGFKVFDLEVARTGLSEEQAAAAGFDAVSGVTTFSSRLRSYPGAETLTVKLVAEKRSGRLLGGQMAGHGTVAKRIDVIATALHARMTAQDLLRLDLTYAPPFATAWEGVQLAAQTVLRQI